MRRNINRGPSDFQRLADEATPEQPAPPHIRDSWLTLLIGLLGIFLGVLVIILNEARAVAATKGLDETVSVIRDIDPYEQIDSSTVGRVIYMTGAITVHEPLTDPEYGISVPAVKLKRRVQMLQWVEEELKDADRAELRAPRYYYFTDWRDKTVDSALFANSAAHANPKEFPVKSQTLINEKVTLGKYELGPELKDKFLQYEEITSDERPESRDVKLHSGLYYHAQDIWNPEVGDLRIQFSYAGMHGQVVSIIAVIDKNNKVIPFKTGAGMHLLLLKMGHVTKEDIFAQEESLNRALVWVYRGVAWFLLYLGSFYMTKIFVVLCQQAGAHPEVMPSVKLGMATSIYLLVTAFAWLSYKPSVSMVLASIVVIVMYTTGIMPGSHRYARYAARAAHFSHAARATRAIRAIRAAHTLHTNRTRSSPRPPSSSSLSWRSLRTPSTFLQSRSHSTTIENYFERRTVVTVLSEPLSPTSHSI